MNVPVDMQVWAAENIGNYLDYAPATVLREVRYRPGFPEPLANFPGNPRWSAKAVIEWALK